MSEDTNTTPVAPEAAPASPGVAPSISVESTPAPETAPVAPAITEIPEALKPEAPEAKAPETLLAGEKKVETAEEPKPTEPEKPVEPSLVPEEKPVEAPAYEPFTLPEGVQVDDAKLGEFTKMLGEFELTNKAPHEEVQKLGQQLVERHLAEMDRYTKSLTEAWEKQSNDWKDSFLKGPEFANRHDTVLNAAIDAISVYGGDAKQQQEFRELMESSKVGNHPAMIRMLSNIMLAKAEPKPLAAPVIAPKEMMSKSQKMYGKKS